MEKTLFTLDALMLAYPQGATVRGHVQRHNATHAETLEFRLLAYPYSHAGGKLAVLARAGQYYAAPVIDEPVWELVEANAAPATDAEIETAFREIMDRNGLGEKKA